MEGRNDQRTNKLSHLWLGSGTLSHTPRHVRPFGYLCMFHDCMYDDSFSTFVFCFDYILLGSSVLQRQPILVLPFPRDLPVKLPDSPSPLNVPWSSRCRNLTQALVAKSERDLGFGFVMPGCHSNDPDCLTFHLGESFISPEDALPNRSLRNA